MASLEELYNHLKTLTSQWFYTKSEVNSSLDDKVDKETGKGLSSNDYTTTEKNKLAGIEAQANKTTVDSSLSNSSENPVQNKVVTGALGDRVPFGSVPQLGQYVLGFVDGVQTYIPIVDADGTSGPEYAAVSE